MIKTLESGTVPISTSHTAVALLTAKNRISLAVRVADEAVAEYLTDRLPAVVSGDDGLFWFDTRGMRGHQLPYVRDLLAYAEHRQLFLRHPDPERPHLVRMKEQQGSAA